MQVATGRRSRSRSATTVTAAACWARPGGTAEPGHGLLGMRERVALFGGSFEAGPRTEGGFGVLAHLPFDAPATRAGLAAALPERRPA